MSMAWRWLVGKREGRETKLEVWKKKGWGAARERWQNCFDHAILRLIIK